MNTLRPIQLDQLPILSASVANNPARQLAFQNGLLALADALVHGGMRKVVHDELKMMFSRLVDKAWKAYVDAQFFHGKGDIEDQELQALYWSISTLSLHDMLSTKKKLDRSKVTGPEIDAMKALAAEAHPIAQAMADVKATLVKGRAAPDPARAAAQENPDKIVRTCPCCFRSIALMGQKMAHHGYERPGNYNQTSSCEGILFAPLEVSSEGLVHVIDNEKSRLKMNLASLNFVPTRDAIDRIDFGTRKLQTITPADGHQWTSALNDLVADLKREIQDSESLLIELNKRLAAWVQTEPEGLSSVKKAARR